MCPISCGRDKTETCQKFCVIKKDVSWVQDSFYGCLTLNDLDPDPILKHLFEKKLKAIENQEDEA